MSEGDTTRRDEAELETRLERGAVCLLFSLSCSSGVQGLGTEKESQGQAPLTT